MKAYQCSQCGETFDRPRPQGDRTLRRSGGLIYCGRPCFFDSRRIPRTVAEKKGLKSAYDRQRRHGPLRDKILKQKANSYYSNHEENKAKHRDRRHNMTPEQYARFREGQRRCQSSPEWKAQKQAYDRQYRAERMYGEYAAAYLVLLDLDSEVESRATPYELAIQRGNYNKAQERKRSEKRWAATPTPRT